MRRRRPSILPLALLAAAASSGCDPHERECDAIHRAMTAASAATDGGAGEDVAAAADRAIAEIDRTSFKTSTARPAADLRAALVSVAAEARAQKAAMDDLTAAFAPLAKGAPLGASLAADGTIVQQGFMKLLEPCTSALFAGLENLFSPAAGGPPPAPPKGNADCETLWKILDHVGKPEPGVSLAAVVQTCATEIDQAKLADPAIVAPARDIAAALHRIGPTLQSIKTPAADLIRMSASLAKTGERLSVARAEVGTQTREVAKVCPPPR